MGTVMTTKWKEPEALGWNRAEVSALASDAVKELGFSPGQPIEPIVHQLGGKIVYGELIEDESDSGSIRIENGKFTINIPFNTSPLRDRFTIAHEIGHFVLHYLVQNKMNKKNITHLRAQRYGKDQPEIEANWFAAAFLMPSDTFRRVYQELGRDTLKVAEYFKVSPSAASVRAQSLGLS